MGTSLIRAMLLASAGVAVTAVGAPTAAYAQEASYQIDIPAQSMGDALRALGKATKQNIVFSGSVVKGKRSAGVRGRMSASDALAQMLAGSGLKMGRGSGGGFTVVQAGNGDAAPARTEVSASGSNVVAVPSASASTVVDARTGAALKGAIVEIVETGEKTSTGDLGDFRFPGKTGSFNLRISYLGYPEYQQFVDLKDGRATSGILLSDGSATGEIVVTAYQSARAQALNQERTAENSSTIISADLLGQFDGTTISDSLRRAPGVAFERDRGSNDGANVIVRGLSSSFNTVTLNGIRLPVGDGASRSPTLSNILTDSISEITINKTLLPNQDGSGTGALIDIKTKGPLDRPDRYANVSVEGAYVPNGFQNEFGVGGTVSARFGASRNFGISLNVQYRKRELHSVGGGETGGLFPGRYLPASVAGRPVSGLFDIDPRAIFPFDDGVDEFIPSGSGVSYNENRTENLSIVAGAQWKIADHTELRLDYTKANRSEDRFSASFGFNPSAGFVPTPIPELGGEVRPAYIWENFEPGTGLRASLSQSLFYVPNAKTKTDVVNFNGETHLDKWQMNYRLGYATGTSARPTSLFFSMGSTINTLTRDQLLPEVVQNTINGQIVTPYVLGDNYTLVMPGLTSAAFDMLNDPQNYRLGFGSVQSSSGSNDRYTAAFDLKREFDSSFVKYIQAGVFWEQSTSASDTQGARTYFPTGPRPISDYGLSNDFSPFAKIGRSGGFNVVSIASIKNFTANLDRLSSGQGALLNVSNSTPNELESLENVRERDLAAFVQGRFEFGKFELIGGARWEQVRTKANVIQANFLYDELGNFDFPFYVDNLGITPYAGRSRDFLPRAVLNYRPAENAVIRLGYYKSIARPDVQQLSGASQVFLFLQPIYGPDFNQPQLYVTRGNPNLKASITHNLDVSFELYDKDVGAIKLAAFYKPTARPFFSVGLATANALDGVILPDDPRFQNLPANIFIQSDQVQNSDRTTKAWGFEASVERRLKFLPGFLSNFGVYANYTYTDSSQDIARTVGYSGEVYYIENARYITQPKHSGTFALNYNSKGLDSSLSYTYQAGYATDVGNFGLTTFREPYGTLDFKISYNAPLMGQNVRLYFEGSDLLRGPNDGVGATSLASADGSSSVGRDGDFYGGRVFRLGASISF